MQDGSDIQTALGTITMDATLDCHTTITTVNVADNNMRFVHMTKNTHTHTHTHT